MKPLIGVTSIYMNSYMPKLDKGDERQKKEYERLTSEDSSLKGLFSLNEMSFTMVFNNDLMAVEEAGGIPIVIPTFDSSIEVEPILDILDGIYFPGGNDVDPGLYNEESKYVKGLLGDIETLEDSDASVYAKHTDQRDKLEKRIIEYLRDNNPIPMLGVCRGAQILNICMGGSLYQDINKQIDTDIEHSDISNPNGLSHSIKIEKNSHLHNIFQKDSIKVNTLHHQSIKDVGNGLKIVAWSEDGIVEAIENDDDDRFILGLQWHPEMIRNKYSEQKKIFDYFVEKSAEYKSQKRKE